MICDAETLPLNLVKGNVNESFVIYSCGNSFVVGTVFKVKMFYLFMGFSCRLFFLKSRYDYI